MSEETIIALCIIGSVFLLLITAIVVICWKMPGSCIHWICVKCCYKNYDEEEIEGLKGVVVL